MSLNAFSLAVSSQWAKLSSWLCGRYQTSVLGEVPHGQEIMFGQVCLLSHVLTEALPCHHFFYCLSGLLSSCSDYHYLALPFPLFVGEWPQCGSQRCMPREPTEFTFEQLKVLNSHSSHSLSHLSLHFVFE